MREIVEAFVHYELVPSGNRLMVTSRPEGVDVDEYKSRFVIVRLPLMASLLRFVIVRLPLIASL